ncbi:MAG: hypothetical protein V4450_07220 [Bacteroidota bacterium]
MKTVLLFAALTITTLCQAQCIWGSKSEPATITGGVLIDWSLKPLGQTGFTGLGVHAGIWIDPNSTVIPTLGVFGGYVESKLNDNTLATREVALTLAFSKAFMNDRLVFAGHFAHGTHNYQDIGFRAGYDIWNNGISVGAFVSRMMHYGFSVNISMKKKN